MTLKRSSRNHRLAGALTALGLALLLLGARQTESFSNEVELPVYDFLTRQTWPWQVGHPDIVLVTIQDDRIWPLSDALLARSLDTIMRGRPAVLGVDMIREDYRSSSDLDITELRRSFLVHPNIVMTYALPGDPDGEELPPPPFVRELPPETRRLRAGFASFPIDGHADNKVRRGYVASDGGTHFSLASLCAFYYAAGREGRKPGELVAKLEGIGSLTPNAGGYALQGKALFGIGDQFLLKLGPNLDEVFPVHSLTSILGMDESSLASHFEGKIVLFGTHAPNTAKDEIEVVGNPALRGVKLHALSTAQILRELLDDEAPVRTTKEWQEVLLLFLAALLPPGLLLWLLPGSSRGVLLSLSLLTIVGVPLLLLTAGAFALRSGTWVPVGTPALAAFLCSGAGLLCILRYQRHEVLTTASVMEKASGHQRASEIWQHREHILEGKALPNLNFEGTILFSDLADSTLACRRLEAAEGNGAYVRWHEAYMNEMVRLVHLHGASVDAFIGDGLMICFGSPQDKDLQHARPAVECALAMRDAVRILNRNLSPDDPRYRLRIGIYTGPVNRSQRGSMEQFDYALSGISVNLAKRLEEFEAERFRNSSEDVRILFSKRTHSLLPPNLAGKPVSPEPVMIDKHTQPVMVWTLEEKSP